MIDTTKLMAGITEGQWESRYTGHGYEVSGPGGIPVAWCGNTSAHMQTEANAALISAAPDLAREVERLRALASAALQMIGEVDMAAFRNGNTHPDYGGPDEGEVLARDFYANLLVDAEKLGVDIGMPPDRPITPTPTETIQSGEDPF